ncbi:hypothetical protein ACHAXT_005161 [Thalassiosira profunda]
MADSVHQAPSAAGSHTPPPSKGSTNDLQELSHQMEVIRLTLDGTLRAHGAARSRARRPCQPCSSTSAALLQLQSQVDRAGQMLQKMRVEAGIQMEPKADSPTSVANLFAEGLTLEDNRGEEASSSVEEAKRAIIGDIQSNAIPAKKEKNSKSFKELMAERRQQKENGTANAANAGTAIGATDTAKIETLDELIASCGDCLTGSPTEYAAWLKGENVHTLEDLAKVAEERPGMLVVGNGRVGMWKRQQFCEAVRAATSSVES